MFVGKWEPGIIPTKPELTSAPIWLELRGVPFQFFNEEGLEYIAGLVGEPKLLHPSTANKTNLEVAKVLTVIDPRTPLPEAVNVKFESGEIKRISVSSPWMPPICSFCRDIGHSLRHCQKAPRLCSICDSRTHIAEKCTKSKAAKSRGDGTAAKEPISTTTIQSSEARKWVEKERGGSIETRSKREGKEIMSDSSPVSPKRGDGEVTKKPVGEASKLTKQSLSQRKSSTGLIIRDTCGEEADIDHDSSDVSSTELEEGEFHTVVSNRQKKKDRGKGLKHSH